MKFITFFILLFVSICLSILCFYLASIFNENGIYLMYLGLLCPAIPLIIDDIVFDIKNKQKESSDFYEIK